MKKALYIIFSTAVLAACNPGGTDQGGTVDDGIKAVDTNGALQDTARMMANPATDTTIGENRTDISTRGEKVTKDTSSNKMVTPPGKGKMIMKDSVQAEIRQ